MKPGPIPIPLAIRFWRFVNKRGRRCGRLGRCWIWTGGTARGGYGTVNAGGGVMKRANRAAWELTNGPIPTGLHALHKCDNPPCVRPSHLFLGTNDANIADRDRKGRTLRGEKAPGAKLKSRHVAMIRARLRRGARAVDLARQFKVSDSSIADISHGRTWKGS